MPYFEDLKYSELKNFYDRYAIDVIVFYGSPSKKLTELNKLGEEDKIALKFFSPQISDESHCGIISPAYFSTNTRLFTESQGFNSCLNKKIAVDKKGEIKNCPSMKTSFGNVAHTSLMEVYQKDAFRKIWSISKDDVQKCQDCEFRYICTDCRAYVENPEDNYSAPLKCGYDPYTCEWKDWSSNPLKQKAINYYYE